MQKLQCPKCRSSKVEQTTGGGLIGDPVDRNRANCLACGWVGVAEDAKILEERNG